MKSSKKTSPLEAIARRDQLDPPPKPSVPPAKAKYQYVTIVYPGVFGPEKVRRRVRAS